MDSERLHKFLAEAGIASRRASEQFILAGRVSVNGEIVRQLGTKVHPGRDQVAVDGQVIQSRRKLYVALHKPAGVLCARFDASRRTVAADLLPKEWRHLYPVGRLDYASEGLLFLTNDGAFSLRLSHPRYGALKVYRVYVKGRFAPSQGVELKRGILDAGQRLQARHVRIVSANNTQSIVEVVLTEGKNREIRRMMSALGVEVFRLVRTQIGPVRLAELPAGKWRTLTEPEIKSLLPKI
jgi:23S rRNA pseudouridine2605 synthase